jgi:tetratricopeptide (TPR) repeat protein
MDCRNAVLGLTLLAGGLGCVHQTAIPLTDTTSPPSANQRGENDSAKHTPKAATCVAFGAFSERCAADTTKYSSVERDRLYDQARKAYQQALNIEPTNLEALSALARLYNKIGDREKAVATYEKAVRANPKKMELWYELGMCHAQQKEWDAALQNLRKAVELDPENRTCARSLGFCLARAGQINESVVLFAKFDGEAAAHYNVARMLHHMNQDDLSKQHLRLALQLQPDMTAAQQLINSLEARSEATVQQTIVASPESPDIILMQPQTHPAETSADRN